MLHIKKIYAVLAVFLATSVGSVWADDTADLAAEKMKAEKLQQELTQEKQKNNMLQSQVNQNAEKSKMMSEKQMKNNAASKKVSK